MAAISLERLATLTGESLAQLREWQERGLLARPAAGFTTADLERVRLIRLLRRRGFGMQDIGDWAAVGWLDRYVGIIVPAPSETAVPLTEAAALAGLEPAFAERLAEAMGFLTDVEHLDADDVASLRRVREAMDAGFPEPAMLEFARVFTEAMERITEVESRLFDYYVVEPLRRLGRSHEEIIAATAATSDAVVPHAEPLLLYLHRRAWERALREDAVLQLAADLGRRPISRIPGRRSAAVAFVDLVDFTKLADAMGDLQAAAVLDRFRTLVRHIVGRAEGRVVKQIGDAFMLVFSDAATAVECALEIERRAVAEPSFPAIRTGAHVGELLYRDGDYVGTTVNLAARVAAEAERHQVLVSAAVRDGAGALPDAAFMPMGTRRLKGIGDPVELFVVRDAGPPRPPRPIDPVCGMEIEPERAAARLVSGGQELLFCSQACLRRFVAA